MKPLTIFFIIFLLLTFAAGLYFCLTHKLPNVSNEECENFEGHNKDGDDTESQNCPDLLIKSGNTVLLYNSKMPEKPGVNPLPFFNLDEYIHYLEIQRKRGIHCPVLFLQEENNTQGQTVYKIRPDVFDQRGGLPSSGKPCDKVIPLQELDASLDNPPYNGGNYNGFDPTGLYVGKYTELDQIHDSTYQAKPLSDNPMDENWGGIMYTKAAVDSGKYAENEVAPPALNSRFTEKSDNIHHTDASKKNRFA
jgi:hypothetical protein